MKTNYQDILDFHSKFGMERPAILTKLSKETVDYRACFMIEELSEYITAYEQKNFEGMIDALVDFSYVVMGTALMHGEDWDTNHTQYSKGAVNIDLMLHTVLSKDIVFDASTRFSALVKLYARSALSESEDDFKGSIVVLHIMHAMCQSMAVISGFNWQLHWDEVHKCNMAKERSSGSDDPRSKRKNSLDVVKPAGWVGPNHTSILQLKQLQLVEKLNNVNNH